MFVCCGCILLDFMCATPFIERQEVNSLTTDKVEAKLEATTIARGKQFNEYVKTKDHQTTHRSPRTSTK